MKLVALTTTQDGRLKAGKIYYGHVIYVSTVEPGLRIVVYDDKQQWMTFAPTAFRPSKDYLFEKEDVR